MHGNQPEDDLTRVENLPAPLVDVVERAVRALNGEQPFTGGCDAFTNRRSLIGEPLGRIQEGRDEVSGGLRVGAIPTLQERVPARVPPFREECLRPVL